MREREREREEGEEEDIVCYSELRDPAAETRMQSFVPQLYCGGDRGCIYTQCTWAKHFNAQENLRDSLQEWGWIITLFCKKKKKTVKNINA